VLTCSGLTGEGLQDVWEAVQRHQEAVTASGSLAERRSRQHVEWMWSMLGDALLESLHAHPAVRAVLPDTEQRVRGGELPAAAAAQQLLDTFLATPKAQRP
jgi:LAO/AO transport system kinase